MLVRDHPHGVVIGLPGVAFEQDGRFYRGDGMEVNEAGILIDAAPAAAGTPADGSDMTGLSSDALKAMVAQFGGRWTNRDAALAFLKGKA